LHSLSHQPEVRYFPIELSATALARCAQDLELLAQVAPIQKSYLHGMAEVAEMRRADERLLVLFLGSTIGNFEPAAGAEFLAAVRACMREGDGLLLGTDLVKPLDRMLAAYDDPAGVTAAFNLNLLSRINQELGADFNLRHFHHEARYDPESQRIEMHLRSRNRQRVRIRGAMLEVEFEAGETIRTEVCYKFRQDQIAGLARAAGLRVAGQWVDQEWGFAESLLV
jgi:dimethylhistidine N-methyltransferase